MLDSVDGALFWVNLDSMVTHTRADHPSALKTSLLWGSRWKERLRSPRMKATATSDWQTDRRARYQRRTLAKNVRGFAVVVLAPGATITHRCLVCRRFVKHHTSSAHRIWMTHKISRCTVTHIRHRWAAIIAAITIAFICNMFRATCIYIIHKLGCVLWMNNLTNEEAVESGVRRNLSQQSEIFSPRRCKTFRLLFRPQKKNICKSSIKYYLFFLIYLML